MGRGRGKRSSTPTKKKEGGGGGGAENVLAMLKGGCKQFYPVLRGEGRTKFLTRDFPIL